MRPTRMIRAAMAGGLVLALAAPAFAQDDVRIRVRVDPQIAAEIRRAVREAQQSDVAREINEALRDVPWADVGREIDEALRDGMRETRRALPALADAAGAWQDRNFRAEQKDTQTRTLAIGASGTLDLKNVSGDVTVTAGGGREATVEITRVSRGRTDADAKLGLERVTVDVNTRGDRGTVEVRYPSENRPGYSVSVAYTVTAPAGTRVNISSVSGDVAVKGITGDVVVNVISGNIKLTDGVNVSSATTISGDVTVSNANVSGALTLSTVSGTATLDQVKCRRLSASVVSGDVIGRDLTCDGAEFKSVSGSVEYAGPLTRGGRYEFQTHSGDVKLTVSGSVGFDLNASTFSGGIRLTPPLQLQAATISRRAARGTVGDGGAVVTATAFSGDVVITKR